MRSAVISTFALAVALVPAAAFAQATTTGGQQPPAQPPASAQQPPAAAAQPAPTAPKVPFATPVGILLVQIKPDQTAVFEEMVGKLRAGFPKTQAEALQKQGAEYELFSMLLKTMTPEEQRDPGAKAMWDRYAGAFAAGLSKLSLTPLGGL